MLKEVGGTVERLHRTHFGGVDVERMAFGEIRKLTRFELQGLLPVGQVATISGDGWGRVWDARHGTASPVLRSAATT